MLIDGILINVNLKRNNKMIIAGKINSEYTGTIVYHSASGTHIKSVNEVVTTLVNKYPYASVIGIHGNRECDEIEFLNIT